MSGQTTIFKVRFTDHLNLSQLALANMAKATEKEAKRGKTLKFLIDLSNSGDSAYAAIAQARALQAGGGFYYEDGQVFLKIKCQRAFDLDSAYNFYRQNGLSTAAFPQNRIDETSKSYHSVKSLKPLVLTPSYQYGRIRENAEAEFYQALLTDDFVAKDILIHCFPGVEIRCPFYVLFNRFIIKVGVAGEDDQTSDLFYDVAVDKVTQSRGSIEIPRIDDKYFFLKRSDLLEAGKFHRFQDIRQMLVYMQPDATCLFVSHDWQLPDMPDPHNRQYKELVQLLKGHKIAFQSQQAYYFIGTRTFEGHHPLQRNQLSPGTFEYIWYDYSCMPQKPRDQHDELLFREQLFNLNNIFSSDLRTVQIGDKKRQKSRSWCVLEQEIAKKNGGINMVFKDQSTIPPIASTYYDMIFALSTACLKGTQATDLDDITIIEWMLYKSVTDNLGKLPQADTSRQVSFRQAKRSVMDIITRLNKTD